MKEGSSVRVNKGARSTFSRYLHRA